MLQTIFRAETQRRGGILEKSPETEGQRAIHENHSLQWAGHEIMPPSSFSLRLSCSAGLARVMKDPKIRTLLQAKAFVLKSKVCGIFSDDKGQMPSLWDVVDLPGRQPGEKGWGQKISAIWTWKNELPARWPDEIFYGKIPGGLAVLMAIDHLREIHFPKTHVPVNQCSPLAQKIHAVLRLDPLTSRGLRQELGLTERSDKSRFDKALQELQTTLNIARRNSLHDKNDTWVLFREQHLEIILAQ